jgi:cytochrome c peroxidase
MLSSRGQVPGVADVCPKVAGLGIGAPVHPIGDSRRAAVRVAIVCVALLSLSAGTPGQVADHGVSEAAPRRSQEPITPIPQPPAADPGKLALGERLFMDQRLSRDGTLSCMSCHDVRTNGADRGGQTMAEDPSKLPLRALTVFNAALNFRLNWEGNYRTLEAQTQSSLENGSRLATSIGEVVGKLNADPAMVRLFKGAYGHGPDESSLLDAIAVYQRSLLTPGGRFDKWIGGDTTAFTAEEQNGYGLFRSLGCVSCHRGESSA